MTPVEAFDPTAAPDAELAAWWRLVCALRPLLTGGTWQIETDDLAAWANA